MAVLSGESGVINGISTVAEWTITPQKTAASGRASNTGGAPIVVTGVDEWSLRFRSYGKQPPQYPGTSFAFVGNTGGGSWSGTAVVKSARLTVDIAGGGYLAWDIECGSASALTPGATSATDSASPQMFVGSVCKVQRDPLSGTFADIPLVQQYTLELSRGTPQYVESGIRKTIAGGVYNCSFTIDQREADPAAVILPGDLAKYKFFVDGSTFFEVWYGRVTNTEHNVPIESGEVIPYRITGTWSAFDDTAPTRTRGKILRPGSGNFWV